MMKKGSFIRYFKMLMLVYVVYYIPSAQRYPTREEHGSLTDDKAGTETTQDLDAKLYYHKVGTPQGNTIGPSSIYINLHVL